MQHMKTIYNAFNNILLEDYKITLFTENGPKGLKHRILPGGTSKR